MYSEKVRFESGSYGSLLVWQPKNPDDLVKYQLHLLTRLRPDYLLPCFLRYRDGMPQLCLDTTGLSSIDKSVPEAKLNPKSGMFLIIEVLEALIDAADRLLPVHHFSLHPSLVFQNPDKKIRLAFWPAHAVLSDTESGEAFGELQGFLHDIGLAYKLPAETIDRYQQYLRQGGLLLLFQQITAETKGQPNFEISAEDQNNLHAGKKQKAPSLKAGRFIILSVLHLLGMSAVGYRYLAHAAWPSHVMWALLVYMGILLILDAICLLQQTNLKVAFHLGQFAGKLACSDILSWLRNLISGQSKLEICEPDAQTVLLAANPADFRMALLSEGMPGSLEENEGLRAYILVDEFIVGRDQKTSDLCLDDPGVGRQHARIIRRAGSFFINDLGSRNGTCLDGRKIMKNTENLLPDQCKISFADHSFYFQAN